MRIIDLTRLHVPAAARLLVDSFAEHWPDRWPTFESALAGVEESLGDGRIIRAALDERGELIGWIGGIPRYRGRVWELQPLAVRADYRGRGLGRALVRDLEAEAAARGGLTLWVATDDDSGLGNGHAELYPEPVQALARTLVLRGHPYDFYRRLGFTPAGVVPDANGPGRPDLLMAKPIQLAV